MKLPIYLDYAATTPVDQRVADIMMQFLTLDGTFGNPASHSHYFGWQAEEAVDVARNQIAELLHVDAREIIFTSGATESDNLAIKGIAHFYKSRGNHIITSQTEHKAVINSCFQLKREGYKITFLKPDHNGIIKPEVLESALCNNTILVSIMHVNNETGIIQNIKGLGALCRSRNIFFHVDATQSVGKLPINLKVLPIDLLSCSAHKLYGPKGIGILWMHKNLLLKIAPQIHGGGQERGMRAGTLPVHQIVGMGKACYIAQQEMNQDMHRIVKLRKKLWYGINNLTGLNINGLFEKSIFNILNVSFNEISGELLMTALKDLALSSGSACISNNFEPSYVLRAMGINRQLADSSLRFSIGRFTTEEEINYTVKLIKKVVNTLII